MVKIIDTEVELIENNSALKKIELAARTCYKSEDKISNESAERLIKNVLIKNGHEAMLEFYSIIIEVDARSWKEIKFDNSKYLNFSSDERFLISGNIRAWRDYLKNSEIYFKNELKTVLIEASSKILFEDVEINITPKNINRYIERIDESQLKTINEIDSHRYYHFKVTASRNFSHEVVRHRNFGYGQESQRYVDYLKKYIAFIKPTWFDRKGKRISDKIKLLIGRFIFKNVCRFSELSYKFLKKCGLSSQDARVVLIGNTKTEINIMGNMKEWKHFFKLRTAKDAYPEMREIANKIKNIVELKERRKL